jgi:heme/copper-type cytochrome/quinol oxidase subunit 2
MRLRQAALVLGGGLFLVLLMAWLRGGSRAVVPALGSAVCQHAFATDDYLIEITGGDNRWQVLYPGCRQTVDSLGAEMARLELHVPTGRRVVLRLHSTDYVYTLELPDWELKEIAVPKLQFDLRFDTAAPGRFELVGDHLCGGVVETLQGALVVEPAPQLCRWLTETCLLSGGLPQPAL